MKNKQYAEQEEKQEEQAAEELMLSINCNKKQVEFFAKVTGIRFFDKVIPDSKGKIHGGCEIPGVARFRYHIASRDPESGCLLGGSVSLEDPETGYVMKKRGQAYRNQVRERREKNLPELQPDDAAFNVFKRLRVRSTDPHTIKMIIMMKVLELFSENILRLSSAAQKMGRIEDMSFSLATAMYGGKYIKKLSGSRDKKHRIKQRLTRVAKLMGPKPIKDLDKKDIEGLAIAIGSNAGQYIVAARKFLDTLASEYQRPISGQNGFTEYIRSEEMKKKKKENDRKKAKEDCVNTDVFSEAELLRLHRKIDEDIEDGRSMALVLAGENIPVAEGCKLLWRDLHFTQDWVWIKYRRDRLTGGQKDFTFAATRFGCRMLRKRYLFVCGKVGEKKARELPIISTAGDVYQSVGQGAATNYCRTVIADYAPESYATMVGADAREAGIKLLRDTREMRLEEVCGIGVDTGLLRHLQHLAPASIQSEHYRALSDESGLNLQEAMLRRDTLGMEVPTGKQITTETQDGRTVRTVHAQDLKRPLTVRIRIKLKAGELVWVGARYGCLLEAGMSAKSKNEKDA